MLTLAPSLVACHTPITSLLAALLWIVSCISRIAIVGSCLLACGLVGCLGCELNIAAVAISGDAVDGPDPAEGAGGGDPAGGGGGPADDDGSTSIAPTSPASTSPVADAPLGSSSGCGAGGIGASTGRGGGGAVEGVGVMRRGMELDAASSTVWGIGATTDTLGAEVDAGASELGGRGASCIGGEGRETGGVDMVARREEMVDGRTVAELTDWPTLPPRASASAAARQTTDLFESFT